MHGQLLGAQAASGTALGGHLTPRAGVKGGESMATSHPLSHGVLFMASQGGALGA